MTPSKTNSEIWQELPKHIQVKLTDNELWDIGKWFHGALASKDKVILEREVEIERLQKVIDSRSYVHDENKKFPKDSVLGTSDCCCGKCSRCEEKRRSQ